MKLKFNSIHHFLSAIPLFITAIFLLYTTVNLAIEAKYVFIIPPMAVLTFLNFKLAFRRLKSDPKPEKESNSWNRFLFSTITFCLGAFLTIMGMVFTRPESCNTQILALIFFALAIYNFYLTYWYEFKKKSD